MKDFLIDKFKDKTKAILETEGLKEPKLCNFINSSKALEMLNKHINNASIIAVHTDIDMDGIGSCYEMYQFLKWNSALTRSGFIINKDKTHGISESHVKYFKENKIGLLIILDSSTNEIEHIKNMNCDVLVIDHHEILHDELSGNTVGGEYCIVNNMKSNIGDNSLREKFGIDIEDYEAEPDMSCGLVVYELMRLYEIAYNMKRLSFDTMLYQWACVTLFTDVIQLANERNQYYLNKTVYSEDLEPSLKILSNTISKYQKGLDKTFINFYLAPKFNRAIRAGASQEALDIALNRPHCVNDLNKYKDAQENAINTVMNSLDSLCENDKYILVDATELGINKNYCGVIAAKLCDKTKKNTLVCMRNSFTGLLEGSFRGRMSGPNYRQYFELKYPGIYAQGHSTAFGFKATDEQIRNIMSSIDCIEPKENQKYYLTAGFMPEELKGIHHIDDMDEFKRSKGLIKLAIANSTLSTEEAINIMILNKNDLDIEWKGKFGHCYFMGLHCMVFEELKTEWLSIYVEYANGVNIYIKNFRN